MKRAAAAITWIEMYCCIPSGPDKGRRVRLAPREKSTIRQIYGKLDRETVVTGHLAAYLALRHIAGREALQKQFCPNVSVDVFTTWSAVSTELREVLRLEGGRIICRELGTSFPNNNGGETNVRRKTNVS